MAAAKGGIVGPGYASDGSLPEKCRCSVVQNPEGRLINIRKLAASDITLHGPRFMLVAFGLGTPAMILFGLWLALTGKDTMFFFGLYFFL